MATTEGDRNTAVASHAGSSASASSGASQSATAAPRWKGRRIKRFRLIDELGRGSMGRVFLAEDTVLKRHVALKLLPARHRDGRPNHRSERLIREARSAATLDHPNAVTIHEIDESSGVHYIAMELVEGGDLERLVRMTGPMEIERACLIAAEAAEAIHHGHQRGIIHRDIKPANLLLTRSGRCKVCDFGLAYYGDALDVENRAKCVGTPHFIAPEVAAGQGATERSDIYSLACTLFFLLTARTPYSGSKAQDLLKHHITRPLPNLREIRPDAPERLVLAIEQACAKKPEDRFDSAERFGKLLRTFTISTHPSASSASLTHDLAALAGPNGNGNAGGASIGASQQLVPIQPSPGPSIIEKLKTNVRRPWVYGGAAAVAAMIAIAAGVYFTRGSLGAVDAAPARNARVNTAAAIPAALPATAGADAIVNGSLERGDGPEHVLGWFIHDRFKESVRVITEENNRFIRLTNNDAKKTVFVDQKIAVDPTWKVVQISARMRATNFKAGKLPAQDARVAIAFKDASGNRVGNWPPVPSVKGDSPWVERVVTADVPAGATSLYVQLAIFNATGIVDFDDIHVTPQQTE